MISSLYPTFAHWSYLGAVYIISDTHFDDPFCKDIDPAWPTSKEYVALLKKSVTENDTIIHLGDVGNPAWMDELPGYKVLIMGNHDTKSLCERHFHEIYDGPLYIGRKLLLSHEPVYVPGAVNIHGHAHNDSTTYGEPVNFQTLSSAAMNRACNVCGYLPLNLGKAIKEGLLSGIKDIHRLTIDQANGKEEGF